MIGAGPAASFLSKYLNNQNNLIKIYEKNSESKTLNRPSYNNAIKNNLKFQKNVKIFYNQEITKKNIKNLDCDIVVLTNGGKENKLTIPGNKYVILSSKIVDNYKNTDVKNKRIGIIGMGNSAFDMCKFLKEYKEIVIFGRNGVTNGKFTNSELRSLMNYGVNIHLNLIDRFLSYFSCFFSRKYKIRYELLRKSAENKPISLFFGAVPQKIIKNNEEYQLEYKFNNLIYKKRFDVVISSIGYKARDITKYKKMDVPIFTAGWAKIGTGDLNIVRRNCIDVAKDIMNYIFKRNNDKY